MLVSMIAAMANNRVIGADNNMPWHLPADLAHFKRVTLGKPIIMGRKTYDSIGKALPGRLNIVVSRDDSLQLADAIVVKDCDQALQAAGAVEEAMIIGGGSIYQYFLPQCQRLYLTNIELEVKGDTYFPDYQASASWQTVEQESHSADEKNPYPYSFTTLNKLSDNQTEKEISLILGNSNSNFSGVTSTMLQVSAEQRKWVGLRIMGKHHLSDPSLYISFWDTVSLCQKPLENGKYRIFHARRVDEMIQALVLRYLFRCKIKIVFSSAAQRLRSGSTVWITRKMDAVVAVSQRSAGFLADSADIVIPHGIQSSIYQPATDKLAAWQALGYGGKVGIAMLGRVRKQKGTHLFVRACIANLPKCPDVTALVVGAISSSHREFYKQLKAEVDAAGLSSRIIFTGELPFEQIPKIFSSVSLVAALSDNEGFGLTVPEAMSAEAAVLATDAGAWPEIIRQGIDGYVVAVNDQAEINAKLQLMLADPVGLQTMGQQGRQRVLSHYSIEREARQLLDFFATLQ